MAAAQLITSLVVAGANGVQMASSFPSGPGLKPVAEPITPGITEPPTSLAMVLMAMNPRAAFSLSSRGEGSSMLNRHKSLNPSMSRMRTVSPHEGTPSHQDLLKMLRKAGHATKSCTSCAVLGMSRTLPLRANVELAALQSVKKKPTAVYALILANLAIFAADKLIHIPFFRHLYLWHQMCAWWQPLTACFCHASRAHLSGNMFLLLLFGRSVEDDMGWAGLLFSFAFCGVVANLVSLAILPSNTVSIGASGAVFGLFAVSTLTKLSFDWRNVVELAVLGEFVFGKIMAEITTAASGGVPGINHVAHLSGAAAGAAMVLLLRVSIAIMEGKDKKGKMGTATI